MVVHGNQPWKQDKSITSVCWEGAIHKEANLFKMRHVKAHPPNGAEAFAANALCLLDHCTYYILATAIATLLPNNPAKSCIAAYTVADYSDLILLIA